LGFVISAAAVSSPDAAKLPNREEDRAGENWSKDGKLEVVAAFACAGKTAARARRSRIV